jgi:putative membrane protein
MPPALTDALLAYAHFLFIILTAGMLAAELVVCRGPLGAEHARRLARLDLVYFACAMLVLASGLARLYLGAKGAAFYLGNPVFHIKVGLFILVGVLSIPPTLRFIRWRKQLAAVPGTSIGADEVKRAARFVHLELGLLLLIPFFAALMARGIGLAG